MSMRRASFRLGVIFFMALFYVASCDDGGGNSPPQIMDFGGTRTAYVGVEFIQEIVVVDSDDTSFNYSWSSDIAGISDREHPPEIRPAGAGKAYFQWTPMAQDVGEHTFEIAVSDGHTTVTQPLTVDVRATMSSSSDPVFVKPLGSGAVLDLSQASCIDVEIEVEDPDSQAVDIYMEEPIEEGYQLQHDGGEFEALFSWCPTARQIDAADRYVLNLAADDRDGHVTRKRFVIILRREVSECPGNPPVINVNVPSTQETLSDIRVDFDCTDDVGLSGPPILYYTTSQVSGDPDVSSMIPLTAQSDGSGYYVMIPNPVAEGQAGDSTTVNFIVEAEDTDNEGTCVHRAVAPETGVYSFTVTHPEEVQGGQPLCSLCVVDAQCGGSNDLCVYLADGSKYCLKDCEDSPDSCPEGTTCSQEPFQGTDGTSRRQCVPAGARCVEECEDDSYEENDSLSSADPLVPDGTTTGLMMCPSTQNSYGDQDWFRLPISETTLVYVEINFSQADGDLDLILTDNQGSEIAYSLSVSDTEAVMECLDPGDYYVLIDSLDTGVHAPYTLYVEKEVGGCCNNDDLESNDSTSQAVPVQNQELLEDLSICENDEDWFAVDVGANKTLHVSMLFDQNASNQDLDMYLYAPDGKTNLTPCCDPSNGQSSTSDEELTYTVDSTGTYFLKVEGYSGSVNTYMIYFEITDPSPANK